MNTHNIKSGIWFLLLIQFFLTIGTGCREANKKSGEPTVRQPNLLFAISDDQSFAHTGFAGFPELETPAFDRVATEGVYFQNAYCSTPSCSASRASILTGRNGWELEESANLWSVFKNGLTTYTDFLEEAGYLVGYTGKPWGPGIIAEDRDRNPAGKAFNELHKLPVSGFESRGISQIDYSGNFREFLAGRQSAQPFAFWYGASEPHRNYPEGIGAWSGKNADNVKVPAFLPDNDRVRQDILDYLYEIEHFDIHLMHMLETLDSLGELDNTLVVVTSDNGMPFPRAKANLYDYGTHLPLAMMWKEGFAGNREIQDFVSFIDLAPTFLEAAGISLPEKMSGKSLIPLLQSGKEGIVESDRNVVYTYRERHAWVQPDGTTCPMRAIRKDNHLLIWNLKPDMWPAGHENPEFNFNFFPFGDVDNSPSKEEVMKLKYRDENHLFQLSFGKRPEFELYDVAKDHFQLNNLSGDPDYEGLQEELFLLLKSYLSRTHDLRMKEKGQIYEDAEYLANRGMETAGIRYTEWQNKTDQDKQDLLGKARTTLESNRKMIEDLYRGNE